jgi:hypothetical protein
VQRWARRGKDEGERLSRLLGYFGAATARGDIPVPGPVLYVDPDDAPVGAMPVDLKT